MLHRRHLLTVCSFFLISWLFTCTQPDDVAGGGSSTGNANTIAGIVKNPDGTRAASCDVLLYHSYNFEQSFDTAVVSRTATDTAGAYTFSNVEDGYYDIYCTSRDSSFSKVLYFFNVSNNDSLFAGIQTLRTETAISGTVENATGTKTVVKVSGTPLFTEIDTSSGWFYIDGLPSVDTVGIICNTLEPVNGQNCYSYSEYRLSADTTIAVTIKLICK